MAKKKKTARKRYFVLMDEKGKTLGIFTGRIPRQAALKAANRGYKKIYLRERGTKKVHIYEGKRVKVPAPEDRPDWMPAKIWKPVVKKVGIKHLDEGKKKKPKKAAKKKATKKKVAKKKKAKKAKKKRK